MIRTAVGCLAPRSRLDAVGTTLERAGITDEYIDKTERLLRTGELFDGGWTAVETHEPAIDLIDKDSVTVVTLDWRARAGD